MRFRKMDENYDMTFGNGLRDFWIDVPDAPAQAVLTRLMLQYGEWFLDREAGTDWNTKVLGRFTANTRDPVIRDRINGTQGVNQILQYSSNLDRDARYFSVQAQIETIYGSAFLSPLIGPI